MRRVDEVGGVRATRLHAPAPKTQLSLCKLFGVELCTLFSVSPRQEPRDGGGMDFEEPRRIGGRLAAL